MCAPNVPPGSRRRHMPHPLVWGRTVATPCQRQVAFSRPRTPPVRGCCVLYGLWWSPAGCPPEGGPPGRQATEPRCPCGGGLESAGRNNALSLPSISGHSRGTADRTTFPSQAAGEPACRPGSVHQPKLADGHPSGTAIADSLMRSTREHRAGRPQLLAQSPPRRERREESLLTLLRVGFTEPPQSPAALVVSYTTVSPLPGYRTQARYPGGLLSVALSRGSPRVGVTDHPALRSPDLPHRDQESRRGRPADSPAASSA